MFDGCALGCQLSYAAVCPVESTISNCLSYVLRFDPVALVEIGNRTRNSQDLVMCPGGQAEFLNGASQDGFAARI